MEGNFHGDLADVVRGGAVASSAGDRYNFPENSDQFRPLDPTRDDEFGDPFSNMRDPFLAELDGIGQRSSPACGSFEDSNGFRGTLQTTPFRISCDSGEMVGAACAFAPMRTCDFQGVISTNHPSMSMESSLIDTARVQICSPRNPITNKRKSQAKKVVCIPAAAAANSRQGGGEVVPSDLWAWRKYGQKPIKGSPYPRGYYRCNSSKGCSARKQVERSRTDPNMLVITYTSEHSHPWPTHRNSLAGSTRIPSKPDPQETATLKKEEITSSSVNEDENGQEEDCNKGLNNVITDQQTMNWISLDYDLFDDLRDFEANPLDPFGSLFDN